MVQSYCTYIGAIQRKMERDMGMKNFGAFLVIVGAILYISDNVKREVKA